jgi:hypothetical protein
LTRANPIPDGANVQLNQILNEKNIIVVVGDLGSGVNLVKNTLLLSEEVDFPNCTKNRLDYIKNLVYPVSLKDNLNQWIKHEYKLRFWQKYYDVDIADQYADIATEKLIKISQASKVIFITHWVDIANRLKQKYPGVQLISVYPKNNQELQWQIATYIDKIGIENLHDFTFFNNATEQKNNYIDKFGKNSYHQLNVLNMFEIMKDRINSFEKLSAYQITVGELQTHEWILGISNFLNLKLDSGQAKELVNTWKHLHSPYSTINHWIENTTYESN